MMEACLSLRKLRPLGLIAGFLLGLSVSMSSAELAPAPASDPWGSPSPDYLTLSEALELADTYAFNPATDCLATIFANQVNTAFLGGVQKLRTGDIQQAYYRFNASCKEGEAPVAQPPLVLLIGMGSAMSDWGASFLQKLQAALPCGREVVVLEYRGAGLSIDYSDQPLTYYSMADGVLQLLDALSISQPVDILGMSTGGDIALLLAALHGDRVNRLIGIGAMAGSRYTVLPDLPDIFDPASFANLTLAQQMAVLFPPQNETFFKAAACQYVASLSSMPEFMTQVNATVMQGQYEADNNFTSVDTTVWDRLPSIRQPVLLLDGSLDTPVPPINARLIAGQLPDARVLYFDGWGHGLMVGDAGSRLADVTAQFVSGGEPDGSFVVPKRRLRCSRGSSERRRRKRAVVGAVPSSGAGPTTLAAVELLSTCFSFICTYMY